MAKARGLRVRPFFVADDNDEEGKRWQLHARKESKDVKENKESKESQSATPKDGDGLGITTAEEKEEAKDKVDSAVAGAEEHSASLTKQTSKASRTGSAKGDDTRSTRSRSPSTPSSPTSLGTLMMSVHI